MNTSTSLSDYPTQLEGMSFDGILDLTADVFLFYGNVELGLTFLFSSTGTRNVHQVTIMSLAGCGFVIYFLDSTRRKKTVPNAKHYPNPQCTAKSQLYTCLML